MMKHSGDEISHWMTYRRMNPIALESIGIFPFTLMGIELVHYRAEKDTWRW